MIVPDVNLLIYAHAAKAHLHQEGRQWWTNLLNNQTIEIGIPWAVVMAYIRLMTHPRVMIPPISPSSAIDDVERWFSFPHVQVINPGNRHLNIARGILETLQTGGNLVTDAHIAAIAIEYQAEVHTTDTDFSRFPGLKWSNPIQG